jgi:uncharacterized protein
MVAISLAKSEIVYIPGQVGKIECLVSSLNTGIGAVEKFAVICHPHPLYQGSMQNKVVTTVAKALAELGIESIRFNYRGVGNSDGIYDSAIGEVADCLSVVNYGYSRWPRAELWLAGFSFGAYIAAKASEVAHPVQLIGIAPAVQNNNYLALNVTSPWLIIQPDNDEVVPPQLVYNWYEQNKQGKALIKIPDSSHFFHGKLIELQQEIVNYF